MALGMAAVASIAAAQAVDVEIPVSASPWGIAAGPAGSNTIWFVEGGMIGRIDTTQVAGCAVKPTNCRSEFPVSSSAGLIAIALGSDGNLWFTENTAKKIGKITTSGVITEFAASRSPNFITAGPPSDPGTLWYTEGNSNEGTKVVRVTTSKPDSPIEYSTALPTSALGAICVGPDGNIWFTEQKYPENARRIARLSVANRVGCETNPSQCITEFDAPGAITTIGGITAGPSGNAEIWFPVTAAIGHIPASASAGTTPTMITTSFANDQGGMTAGPLGAVWAAGEVASNAILRITTGGTITKIDVPTSQGYPRGITVGPDGNIWFAERFGNKVGRVNLSAGPPGPTPTPAPHVPRGRVTPVAAPTPKSNLPGRP